jgi:septal ring factor EnvC (AmiA/AmiB activator)
MGMNGMSTEEVKAVRWVEWILAPLLVVSVLSLGKCTADAQDELIVLQKDVQSFEKTHVDTDDALQAIQQDVQAIKIENSKIQNNQEHFTTEIQKIQRTQEETNRLLRAIAPR